jgi:hypothetical protein
VVVEVNEWSFGHRRRSAGLGQPAARLSGETTTILTGEAGCAPTRRTT